jgi:hypothetical protein
VADHRVRIQTMGGGLFIWCTCSPAPLNPGDRGMLDLDEINRLAHEHIEAAEQADEDREMPWCRIPGHKHRTTAKAAAELFEGYGG